MDVMNQVFDRFDSLRVLVVGDLMVDEHVWGTTSRVSPEAPVLVVNVNGDSELLPGGAANVVNNIKALGGGAAVTGIVGDDAYGKELDRQLAKAGVDTSGLVFDPDRVTTTKTRIWVSHRQQVVRVDRESSQPVTEDIGNLLLARIKEQLPEYDALLLSDYNKGVLTHDLASQAIELARGMGKICTANPKPVNIHGFQGASVIVVNQSEAEAVAGFKFDDEDSVICAGEKMLADLELDCLVITRGAAGLTIFEKDDAHSIPAIPIEVYDVAGAGDTVISALTLSLAAGAKPQDAAWIANCAAGAAVRKVGVAAVTRDEIRAIACAVKSE